MNPSYLLLSLPFMVKGDDSNNSKCTKFIILSKHDKKNNPIMFTFEPITIGLSMKSYYDYINFHYEWINMILILRNDPLSFSFGLTDLFEKVNTFKTSCILYSTM